jgi:multicomponent Na+:H+ antiporter subunit B
MTTAAPPRRRKVTAAVLVSGTAVCLAGAFLDLPREDADLPGIARDAMAQALPEWHHTEVVSVLVYGTRAFDTFGETFLLLAAVVGVIVVCRGRERRRVFLQEERLGRREQGETRRTTGRRGSRRHPQAEHAEDVEQGLADEEEGTLPIGAGGPVSEQAMTVVVRTGARTVLPLLSVAGAFLLFSPWAPGGGFPAGGVLTGVVLLTYAAFGYRAVRRVVRPSPLEAIEMAGAGAIIGLGVLGLVLEGSFFANWLPLGSPKTVHAGGILQVFSMSELLEVGAGLLIVVFSLVAMEREWTEDDAGEDEAEDEREEEHAR